MTTYNERQLANDLQVIARRLGKKVPHGTFKINVYQDGDFKIVDNVMANPKLFRGEQEIKLNSLSMSDPLADRIMKLSMQAREGWRKPR